MSIIISGDNAILWVTRISVVYLIINCAEKLYAANQYKNSDILGWYDLRRHTYFLHRPNFIKAILNGIFCFNTWIALIALRGILAIMVLFLSASGFLTTLCLGAIFVIISLSNLRAKPLGAETEDRVMVMITGALFLRSLMPDAYVTTICLWFIALQSCLSYVAAGLAKINNKSWLKGNGLYNVFTTGNFHSEKLGQFAIDHWKLVRLISWATIIIECAFPLVLIVKTPYGLFFLIWGLIFHFIIALIFKFGKFFLVWIATYPAILFVIQ